MQNYKKSPLSDADGQNEFGLPETHYKPIERNEGDVPSFKSPTHYYEEDEDTNNTGWIVGGIAGLLVIIAAVTYLLFFDGAQQLGNLFGGKEPEPVVRQQETSTPEPATPVYEEPEPVEEPVAESTPANPLAPYQDISTVYAPTGMSYIVIGSFVDADMANDLAQKMLKRGVGVKIILPSQRSPLQHRVVVAEYSTFKKAMQQIKRFRNEYGEKAWVLKY